MISFNVDPKELFADIIKDVNSRVEEAIDNSSEFMLGQLDLSFDNSGFLQKNNRGFGFEPYQPTSIIAKKKRKNPPSNTKLYTANSLEDTGALRNSLAIEKDDKKNELNRYIGAGVAYIDDIENGSTITVDGVTYEVPERRFQHITEEEQDVIAESFEELLNE